MKKIIILLLLLMFPGMSWGACGGSYTGSSPGTITAYDCTRDCIQDAVNAATADNDIVQLPACGSVSSPIDFSTSYVSVGGTVTRKIKGHASGSYLTGSSSSGVFYVTASSTGKYTTISDIYFRGTSAAIWAVKIADPTASCSSSGCWGTSGQPGTFRITNNTFDLAVVSVSNARTSGLVDKNTFKNTTSPYDCFTCIPVNYILEGGWAEWTDESRMGNHTNPPHAVYVENNYFNFDSITDGLCSGSGFTDVNGGGRVVARFNKAIDIDNGGHGAEVAITGQGTRTYESYNNRYVSLVYAPTAAQRGGTHIWFNNQWVLAGSTLGSSQTAPLYLYDPRAASASSFPWTGGLACPDSSGVKMCAKDSYAIGSACTTDGDCGTNSPCIAVDGNADASGYRCRNQVGSGPANATTGIQGIEPVYAWNNLFCTSCSDSDTPTSYHTNLDMEGSTAAPVAYRTVIQADRDYFNASGAAQTSSSSPFNGTTGMGYGTLANRPSTCAYNETTGVGVGYYDNVNNVLYRCTADDTWTAYYSPYTCPHPLATEYSGYSCNYSIVGRYDASGSKEGLTGGTTTSMTIGSGATMSLGSGAVLTLQ